MTQKKTMQELLTFLDYLIHKETRKQCMPAV
jgi:hypothetical protein